MKRLAIALPIILLLAILSPCFSILAQPAHTPHQNPMAAQDSPDLVSLLAFYGNVFNLAAVSQYQDAQSMLNELEYANIPDELRYIIDRFNTLSRQLFTTLDNLELLLDEASASLSHYQISDAKQKLDAAKTTLNSAQLLLEDIEAATDSLVTRLANFIIEVRKQTGQPYDQMLRSLKQLSEASQRLEEIQQRLRQLIDELDQLRQSLMQKYETQTQAELIPTELSLRVIPASVFVGDSIIASGRLTADTSALAKRKLSLLCDNEPLVITTEPDGSYATNITIPYKYVSTMTLNAVYTPSDDDIGTYLASKSPTAVINTSFYSTLLEVTAPETAHPGLPATISGQVSSTDGTVDRTIKVLLDNTQLAEEIIQGEFSLQIAPPPQISTGEHSLTLTTIPRERYSGTSKSLTINISKLPIQADIKAPQLVVTPKVIQISGKVYHSLGPVEDARVNLTFGRSSTTVETSTDGSFDATIEAPLDLSLIGPQELSVIIEPVQPWYTSLQIKRGVFSINSANIGLMLAAFVSLGILLYTRVRTRAPSPREETGIPEAAVQELPTVAPPSRPRYEFTGIKGRILSAYLNGLAVVETATGISMASHTTLREFLKATTPRLPGAIEAFTELTLAAEIALYSVHKLKPSSAARAEQLAAAIEEELHNEAA